MLATAVGSLLMACVASPLRADISVAFNEIMYHPATNEPAMEWVEVRNQMSVDVDLTGWSIAGGIQFDFRRVRDRGRCMSLSCGKVSANCRLVRQN